MRDVVVVGSLNVDVSLRAERLPSPGETVRASGLEIGPGGKGLNQAVAAARLGALVHLVGRVGDDAFARIPLEFLERENVNATYVERLADSFTGTASIVVDAAGQNAIAVAGGANGRVRPGDVRAAVAAFRASSVLLVQLELPPETVEAALDLAAEHGVVSVLDPAPARPLEDALLAKVDVLTPNETEAELLSGVRVADVESAARAGSILRERTQGDVIVTVGAHGCVWCSATGFQHLQAPRVQALDTTGAGDAFNGALAVELARERPLVQAISQALRAGSASTLARGAAVAMPRPAALAQLG